MATSLKIDPELKSRIQHLADIQRRSAHWIMLQAINDYVKRQEARESFKQEALESWEHFQKTGLHLTGDELFEWLDTWGSENSKPIPPCHK